MGFPWVVSWSLLTAAPWPTHFQAEEIFDVNSYRTYLDRSGCGADPSVCPVAPAGGHRDRYRVHAQQYVLPYRRFNPDWRWQRLLSHRSPGNQRLYSPVRAAA